MSDPMQKVCENAMEFALATLQAERELISGATQEPKFIFATKRGVIAIAKIAAIADEDSMRCEVAFYKLDEMVGLNGSAGAAAEIRFLFDPETLDVTDDLVQLRSDYSRLDVMISLSSATTVDRAITENRTKVLH